jgi:hypothetical protein
MPVIICPRCQHFNPEYAIYCHFDGVVLQAQQSAAVLRLPSEFVFPSGRRCKTFDELGQGCQEEWMAARDLLARGVFAQYFRTCHRADLVRAANDAQAMPNPDIALTTFLTSLPGTRTQTPKVDLSPRRILIGKLLVGETKTVPLTITNQGQGVLQGTITVTEGQDWLSLSEAKPLHELEVTTVREQSVKLTVNTKGIAAGQTYGAKLTVVTNGGVVEVPIRMDLVAQPFTKPPFQGARSQREFAEKMRAQPKVAVPMLESGDVQRWFALNGWIYPVQGTPIKGIGGVQQFFEGIGVSKPPTVALSQSEFRFTCRHRDTVRGQVTLQTLAKKWVYAQVTSDSPWLRVLTPQVAGPQNAAIQFEIDTSRWNLGSTGVGTITVEANGKQTLKLKVTVEVQGLPAKSKVTPRPPSKAIPQQPPSYKGGETWKFLPALVTTILLCLLLRVTMVPFVDMLGRGIVTNTVAEKLLGNPPAANSPAAEFGGWLHLDWKAILGGGMGSIPARVFVPDTNGEINMAEFRHYFVSYFIRWFVLCTFWIGAIVGAVMVLRRGSTLDLPWGIIAGAIAGLGVSATLAAFFLAVELIPHTLWHLAVGERGGTGLVFLWVIFAVTCWFFVGLALGMVVPWIGPLRRLVIEPFQAMFATAFRGIGLTSLEDYWSPV